MSPQSHVIVLRLHASTMDLLKDTIWEPWPLLVGQSTRFSIRQQVIQEVKCGNELGRFLRKDV